MVVDIEPNGYLPRIVDAQLERCLRLFGAVELCGTKWCGKTSTALMQAESVTYVDDMLGAVKADPAVALQGAEPHLIDEWQLVPDVWDSVRRGVDAGRGRHGRWILTGSSTPLPASGGLPAHSGAGRFGRIRMLPMTLAESGESSGLISLAGLFDGEFEPASTEVDTVALVGTAVRGGWPEAIRYDETDAAEIVRSYLANTFSYPVEAQGLSRDTARRVAVSVARNLGQATTLATLARDVEGEDADVATARTVSRYLEFFRSTYLTLEVPGWVPPRRGPKRFQLKPKRYFCDPSIPCELLGMSSEALLKDWQTFGLVFENLVMRDLQVYALANPKHADEPVRYYRDDSGLEVDAIVELADGRWGGIEIKTTERKVEEAVRTLERFEAKLARNAAARTDGPSFLAVVTGAGGHAFRTSGGVYVVPATLLGP